MVRIVLIRPGTTDYDQQELIQGNLDVPLNEQGRAEVEQLVEPLRALDLETIYSASGEPSEETAATIAVGLKIRHRPAEQFENMNLGLWQGMAVAEVKHKQPRVYRQWQEQPETVCPPEGESIVEVEERLRPALGKLLRRHRDGVIALVLPEPLLSITRRLLLHGDLDDLWRPALAAGRFEALAVEPDAVFAPTA